VLAQRIDELLLLALELRPARADRVERGQVPGVRETRGRGAFPPGQPEPFGAEDVHERRADGGEAAAEILVERFGAELRRGVEDTAVGPAVVGEELAQFVDHCHSRSIVSLSLGVHRFSDPAAGANSRSATRTTPSESVVMPSARSRPTNPSSSKMRAGQVTRAKSFPSAE